MIGQDSPAHPPKNKMQKSQTEEVQGSNPLSNSRNWIRYTELAPPPPPNARSARSLYRLHAQQNATQRRILQQEQQIESWIIIPISSELCTDFLKLRLSAEKSANGGAAAAAVLWSEGPDASGSHLLPHVIISTGAISSSSLSNHVCHQIWANFAMLGSREILQNSVYTLVCGFYLRMGVL